MNTLSSLDFSLPLLMAISSAAPIITVFIFYVEGKQGRNKFP